MRSTLPALLVLLLALGCPAFGQYTQNFDGLAAQPAGVPISDILGYVPGTIPCPSPLPTQDCYYVPAGTTSVEWNVYTYTANGLGLPQNPNGGTQFVAGTGPGTPPATGVATFARAQRDISFGTGVWTAAFDTAVTYPSGGILPTAQNIGSFSLQDTTSVPPSQYFIALAAWADLNTALTWNADYVYFDAAGLQVTGSVPDPGFQNLNAGQWYHRETDFDLSTNQVLQVRITDLSTMVTSTYSPPAWYMAGGANVGGTFNQPPIAFRLFAGSATAGTLNTLAFDNLDIGPAMTLAEYQLNQAGASFDVNGASNTPFTPIQVSFLANTIQILNLNSTNAGLFWDMALTIPEPSVPLSGGGFPTPGGQVVNIDLFAPSLTFLNPGFPFVSAALPLSFPGPISITGQLVVADPLLPDGFALSAVNELSAVGCLNPVNFDGLAPGLGSYPLGWSDGGGISQWTVQSGGTTSTATGPTSANSLPNYYYCETSVTAGTTYIADTCTFDTTGIASPTLSFALSRIGAFIGTLNIWQDDGLGNFTTLLMTYTGADPLQTQGGVEWSQQSIPFIPVGSGARFRFDYTAVTTGTVFQGDLAIDDVLVQ